jgi:hypothetical protein
MHDERLVLLKSVQQVEVVGNSYCWRAECCYTIVNISQQSIGILEISFKSRVAEEFKIYFLSTS